MTLGLTTLLCPTFPDSGQALDGMKFLITLKALPDEEADNLENVKELVGGLDMLAHLDVNRDNLFQIECPAWKKGSAVRQKNP